MKFYRGEFSIYSTQHPILKAIRSLGFLDMKKGPWVAGGAVRRVIENDPNHTEGDIDIFGSDSLQVRRVEATLMSRGDTLQLIGNNTSHHPAFKLRTYIKSEPPTYNSALKGSQYNDPKYDQDVQIITSRFFSSVDEMLMDFDFTVCMAATDGWSWIVGERFFDDLANRELVLNNKSRREKSLSRLEKYCAYGFTPTPEVFKIFSGLEDDSLRTSIKKNGYIEMRHGY